MTQPNPYATNPYSPTPAGHNRGQRYTVLAVIILCTVISLLLADSLLGVWRTEIGNPVPGGWQWLVGDTVQTFRTQTIAMLVGMTLLGFAVGGFWFLLGAGYRALRRLF